MIKTRVCCYLFLLLFLDSAIQIRPSFHGHNNAFVQDDSEVQYLLENIPISMHKEFTSSVHGSGDSLLNDKNVQDSNSYIHFEPRILDFKERQLGVPHQEIVTLVNRDGNRTIHLTSISGSTQHFHSSFFQDKVIPPLGNTTFNVVFLGRDEGEIDSHLFIHTSDGTFKYQVKGSSISSPYRLHPVVGVKLPLNASFTPLIYMHNPHPEAMQVTEVYSSGGEFQLELPSGEAEGPRELWEIPPYQTKPIIRLHLNAYVEKNHTAYVRLKVNNSDELMVVAVEVEVGNGAGLHWGGNSASINFGMGGSQQPALRYPIVLRNSAKKPIKIVNVISTPVSKALKIEFETMSIPGDTDKPITIGTLIYDWKEGLDLKHYKGKLVIKGIGPGGSNQKLSIPWIVQVIQGGLGINSTLGHYCSPHTNEPRNFTIKNHFKQPIAITNITLKNEAMNYFTIKNFIPNVIKPGENKIIFSLHINVDKLNNDNNIKIDSSILINTNVSTTDIPLLRYDGKVKKIIPDDDDGTMNFGTVSSGTENEAIFALENSNPINIELHGWGVNMPGAVLELMGCKIGPLNNFNKIINNITVCSYSGNQSIKPGYLAIFKIKVKTSNIEEDTIVGDVFVRTSYERLIVPVYMRVAHGKISLKKLTFTNCFPGSICMQQIKIHSTFSRSMRVTFVSSINNDSRIEYIPLGKEEKELPTISKGDNIIGSIKIDPSITCNENCYLGLSLNDSIGNQWLNTMSLPSHTRDSDLNLLNARYSRYLNSTGGTTWDNITMRLDTTEVRGHKFLVNIKPYWPSLIQQITGNNNRTFVKFPLTQVGNTSFKNIKIYNPSTKGILLQLVMDCNYPQGSRLYQSLPNKFKQYCPDCKSSIDGEFKLQEGDDDDDERNEFNKLWDIVTASNTLSFYLNSGESKIIKLFYTPSGPLSSSGLLFIRNNLTILEVVRLIGRGVHAQFKFGDRKPGSKLPLLFEITDKHLRDCERDSNNNNNIRKLTEPNLTVKRSFIAKNTGELPINFNSFYINGLECEGYGYRILNCQSFKLNPNGTKKIYIAFTPDFTLSKIERELWISTSLGKNKESEMIVDNNGIVKLTLLTTIPEKSLDKCSIILQRHPFEEIFHWCTTIISGFLLIAVLYFSHSEANLIIKTALEPRSSPVQPSLDLRQLAIQTNNNNNKKDEAEKIIKKKDEPDWNLMNVKKLKNDNNNKNSIIPDWTIEEEKKFKIDMEMKNINIKQNENSEYTIEIIQKKKKIKFDIENKIDSHEHDKLLSSSTKSSPTVNRKYNKKDDDNNEANNILLDNKDKNRNKIIPTTTTTIHQQQQQHNNNNGLYKKYDNNINTSQKQQYSEEETSSTTTESSLSNHEDHINYKDDDYLKTDNNNKLQKKNSATGNKKSNKISLNLTEIITSGGDNCELENNCEDDEFYKDRQENPNKWRGNSLKTSPTTIVPQSPTGKTNNPPPPPSSSHLQSTKPQKAKNIIPKKEKVMPKKIIKLEKPPKSIGFDVKQDKQSSSSSSSSLPQASGPPPPPPSLSRWGENRARFSDVVARNPDNTSPAFSIPPSSRSFVKQDTMQDHQIYLSHGLNQSTENNNRNIPIIYKPTVEYSSLPTKFTSQQQFFGMQQQDQKNLLEQDGMGINHNQYHNNHRHHQYHHHQHQQQQHQHHSHHQNNRNNYQQQRQHHSMSHSYFANTFEPNYERELVPYDDLPETNEPMVELESFDDHGECQFWNDKISSANKLANKTDYEPVQKVSEKLPDLTDTFKDNNWVNVETNWKPLYARGAVGEERSGVWGVNTGGVWAAAPWEAPVQPTTSLLQASSLEQTNENSQEHSAGFDPFKSLSSIWSPVTTNWDTLREE